MEKNTDYSKIENDLKSYLSMRYDLLRLEVLEKLSKVLAVIVLAFVAITLVLAALIYFSFALSFALKTVFGSVIPGFCIIGGLFLILLAIVYAFRQKLLIDPLIQVLGSILFQNDEQVNNADVSNPAEAKENDKDNSETEAQVAENL